MIYFVSDVHLGFDIRETDKIREQNFLNFLDSIKKDCEILYLVGDIFDYWFEYKTVIPKYFYKTLSKFAELRDLGIKIEFVMGNHDFGLRDFFEEEFGIVVYKSDIERIHNGKKFYISHGDGKANNDTGYRILKKIMRAEISMKLFLMLHPNIGIGMASGSSHKSRKHTDKKHYGNDDGMISFAKDRIDNGFDYVVMGHRHKAMVINHNEGFYINLGEWIKKPHFASFDGENLKLIEWTNPIQPILNQ